MTIVQIKKKVQFYMGQILWNEKFPLTWLWFWQAKDHHQGNIGSILFNHHPKIQAAKGDNSAKRDLILQANGCSIKSNISIFQSVLS